MPEDPKPKLVLMDDSELILATLSHVLANAGYEIRAVSSLRQFLNAVLDWRPDIVVTDLYMPNMSGAELCTWLRAQIQTSRTPIVICSSAPTDELAEVARRVGADAYVSKLAGPEALSAKLLALREEMVW